MSLPPTNICSRSAVRFARIAAALFFPSVWNSGAVSPRTSALALLLVVCLGCGGEKPYPTTGQVFLPDGKPLVGGRIEFRGQDRPISAVGAIGDEGRFELNLRAKGDGALVGRYRAVLLPPPNSSGIPGQEAAEARAEALRQHWLSVVPPRYQSIDTSDLEFEVTDVRSQNFFKIDLQP